MPFDDYIHRIEAWLLVHQTWSANTFGTSLRTEGVLKHIEAEISEVREQPFDVEEWIDIMILAMDGYWRHGGEIDKLMPMLTAKLRKNMARTYVRTGDDEPSFHKK